MNDYSELRAKAEARRDAQELNAVKVAIDDWNGAITPDVVLSLLDEVERLRAALTEHGEHGGDCPGISDWEKCDCGFTAAYSGDALNSSTEV